MLSYIWSHCSGSNLIWVYRYLVYRWRSQILFLSWQCPCYTFQEQSIAGRWNESDLREELITNYSWGGCTDYLWWVNNDCHGSHKWYHPGCWLSNAHFSMTELCVCTSIHQVGVYVHVIFQICIIVLDHVEKMSNYSAVVVPEKNKRFQQRWVSTKDSMG